jgi:hypothetical protein
MPQLSYSINLQAVSYPGQPADLSMQKDVLSGQAVAAALPYGVLVVLDSANSAGFDKIAAKLPSLAADITTSGQPLGVVVADQARAQDASVLTQYPQNSVVPVMRKGRIWVRVEEAVVDGDLPFVRFASGAGGTQLGAFRKSADTATAAALPGAVFRSAASAGGYAVIQLNIL